MWPLSGAWHTRLGKFRPQPHWYVSPELCAPFLFLHLSSSITVQLSLLFFGKKVWGLTWEPATGFTAIFLRLHQTFGKHLHMSPHYQRTIQLKLICIIVIPSACSASVTGTSCSSRPPMMTTPARKQVKFVVCVLAVRLPLAVHLTLIPRNKTTWAEEITIWKWSKLGADPRPILNPRETAHHEGVLCVTSM